MTPEQNVDKPIKDWTVGEIKEYCNYGKSKDIYVCDTCKFNGICGNEYNTTADEWDLSDNREIIPDDWDVFN